MESDIKKKIQKFFSKHEKLRFAKGDIVIHPNDSSIGAFFLEKGYVSSFLILNGGKSINVHIFAPGSFFPMTWVISDLPNRYFFKAVTNCSIRHAPKKDVLKFLTTETEVFLDLTRRILTGLDKFVKRTEQIVSYDANSKLISILHWLIKHFGEHKSTNIIRITTKLTHEDLSNFAGLTRETTSRIMESLKKKAILNYNDKYLTVNISKLSAEEKRNKKRLKKPG